MTNPCNNCIVASMCKKSCDPLNKYVREFFSELKISLPKYALGTVSSSIAKSRWEYDNKIVTVIVFPSNKSEFKNSGVRVEIKNGKIIQLYTKTKNIKRVVWRIPKKGTHVMNV